MLGLSAACIDYYGNIRRGACVLHGLCTVCVRSTVTLPTIVAIITAALVVSFLCFFLWNDMITNYDY